MLLLLAPVAFAQPVFNNKIPIPYIVDSSGGINKDTLKLVMEGRGHYFDPLNALVFNSAIDQLNGTRAQRLLPNPLQRGIPASVYNLNDSSGKPGALTFLGPTLVWHTSSTHYTYIHLKNNLYPKQQMTTHWHGAEIPAVMDGGPHQAIDSGATWKPYFINLDPSSTLWYHPHLEDYTVQQVSNGLSGMILSREIVDPIAPKLPRTYGVDDIPLILGDMAINKLIKNSASTPCPYGADSCYTILNTGAGGNRPINLVNGVTNPFVNVPAAWVRLRILGGSSRKGMQFGFSNNYDAAGTIDFTLIATDGGYVVNTDILADNYKTLLTGPGQRTEILLNLTGRSGDSIYMSNMRTLMDSSLIGSQYPPPAAMGGGSNGAFGDTTNGKAFLKIRILPTNSFPNYTPVTSIPAYTSDWPPEVRDTFGINRRRVKNLILTKVTTPAGTKNQFTIDYTDYKMHVINDTICLGAKEIWTINNLTPVAHPFHIHKVFVRVLDVKDAKGNPVSLEKYGFNGPKDDMWVLPGWSLRFLTVFDDYPTEIAHDSCYMYHCHILTHEDAVGGGMMHQFVVTKDPRCFPPVQYANRPVMRLFPNPASGELFIGGVSDESSTVQIFDEIGRLVMEQKLNPFWGNTNINIEGILSGFYLVRWNNSKGSFVNKVQIYKK